MGVLSLLVKLGLDSAAFEMGVKRAQSVGEKFGNSFKSAVTSKIGAALSVAAIAAYTKSIIDAAGEIKDMGEQMNLTTDEVQRLQILAGDTGVSFDNLAAVLRKFEETRLKATQGDENAIKTLNALKISNDDLYNSQLSTIDGAVKAAKAQKESGGSAETTAAMIEIYGSKLKAAGAAMADYEKTQKRTIIDNETINNLDKYNKLFEEQIRLLKAFSAVPIDFALKTSLGPVMQIYGDIAGFMDKAERATRKAMIARLPDELLSRVTQQQLAEERKVLESKNPPPIGSPEYELVKGPRFNLGGSQDPLARIGGFTGFQSTQDLAIRQAIEQTLQLKQINKNTSKTATKLSGD